MIVIVNYHTDHGSWNTHAITAASNNWNWNWDAEPIFRYTQNNTREHDHTRAPDTLRLRVTRIWELLDVATGAITRAPTLSRNCSPPPRGGGLRTTIPALWPLRGCR